MSDSLKPLTLLAVAIVLSVGIPAWVEPSYYYHDDIQHQYLPVFFEIGKLLREGQLPFVSARTWYGGNFLAEYQYGLLNPVSLALYAVLPLFDNLAHAAFFLVLSSYIVLGLGMYALLRQFDIKPYTAVMGAVCLVANPLVSYWFASGWYPALVSLSWLPWAIVYLRKAAISWRAIPAGALFVYLVGTSGWPHTLVALGIIICLMIALDAHWRPRWRLHGGWFAATGGLLLTLPALIPLLIFRAYTERPSMLDNTGKLNAPLSGLINLGFPSHTVPIVGVFGDYEPSAAPYFFMGIIFLPLLAVFSYRKALSDRQFPGWQLALVGFLTFLLLSLGPSQLGPLRWPFRFLPICALFLILLACIAYDRGWLELGKQRRITSIGICCLGFLLAWQQAPGEAGAHLLALATVLVTLACLHAARHDEAMWPRVAVGLTLLTTGWMHLTHPSNLNVADWGVPIRRSEYSMPPTVSPNDNVVTLRYSPSGSLEIPNLYSGNLSIFTPMHSLNGYSPLQPAGFGTLLCFNLFSWSCPTALENLGAIDPSTGISIAKMLGVTRLIIDNRLLGKQAKPAELGGGTQCFSNKAITVYCLPRNNPALPLVSYLSPGWRVDAKHEAADSASLLIAASTNDIPGLMVLSRAWYPGIAAHLDGKPLRTYAYRDVAVAIELPQRATGLLQVEWEYPGKAAALLAVLLGMLCLGLGLIINRQTTSHDTLRSNGSAR